MMDCETAGCLLDLFRENRLTPAKKAEVKKHLDSCRSCSPISDGALSGTETLPKGLKTSIPEDLREKLKNLSPAEPSAPAHHAATQRCSSFDAVPLRRGTGDPFVLAAAAALAFVLFLIHFGTDTVPQQRFDNTQIAWSRQ